jgi:glutathione S-transferase
MALQLVIGNKSYSSWSLRPWLLLKQFNVNFEEINIALRAPDWSAQMAPWSPAGKVPALKDGDLAIWDSLAIAEHLNETYLNGRGWPSELHARTQARCISAEMHSGFSALRNECPMNVRRVDKAVPQLSAAAAADITRVLEIWATALQKSGGPFLFGDFSIADAFYAPVVSRLHSYALAPPIELLRNYSTLILNLPAMQQWYAQAAAETTVLLDYEQR